MSVIGKRSLAKPGSIPVVKHDARPSSQALVIGAIQSGGLRVIAGHTQGVIAVEHMDAGAGEDAATAGVVARGRRGRPVVGTGAGGEREAGPAVGAGGAGDGGA